MICFSRSSGSNDVEGSASRLVIKGRMEYEGILGSSMSLMNEGSHALPRGFQRCWRVLCESIIRTRDQENITVARYPTANMGEALYARTSW